MNAGYEISRTIPPVSMVVMLLVVLIVLAVTALSLAAWCMIFKRTGYSWALGLLVLVPIANIVVFLVLAFSKWPIQRELEELRTVVMHRQAPPQGGQIHAGDRPAQ